MDKVSRSGGNIPGVTRATGLPALELLPRVMGREGGALEGRIGGLVAGKEGGVAAVLELLLFRAEIPVMVSLNI